MRDWDSENCARCRGDTRDTHSRVVVKDDDGEMFYHTPCYYAMRFEKIESRLKILEDNHGLTP